MTKYIQKIFVEENVSDVVLTPIFKEKQKGQRQVQRNQPVTTLKLIIKKITQNEHIALQKEQ